MNVVGSKPYPKLPGEPQGGELLIDKMYPLSLSIVLVKQRTTSTSSPCRQPRVDCRSGALTGIRDQEQLDSSNVFSPENQPWPVVPEP